MSIVFFPSAKNYPEDSYFKVTVNSLLMNIHDFSYNDFCETINAMREI